MKIGKREILVNPNATKFACMLAILTGWYMWPREHHYKQYAAKIEQRQDSDVR